MFLIRNYEGTVIVGKEEDFRLAHLEGGELFEQAFDEIERFESQADFRNREKALKEAYYADAISLYACCAGGAVAGY